MKLSDRLNGILNVALDMLSVNLGEQINYLRM